MKTACALLFAAFSLFVNNAFSQWDGNSTTANNPFVETPVFEKSAMITDNYGGAIVAGNIDNSLYIQRKTVGGILNWNNGNKVLVYQGTGLVKLADMIPDENGGAFLSWIDYSSAATTELYLQHISSNGETTFPQPVKINPFNRPICNEGKLCLSSNGINIVWSNENRQEQLAATDSSLLFLNKYNFNGQLVWGEIAVSTAPGLQIWPAIASDSADGVYLSYTDTRNSTASTGGYHNHYDVYLQHFDENGNRLWGDSGLAVNDIMVSEVSFSDYSPPFTKQRKGIMTDANGAVIVLYNIETNGFAGNAYARKIDAGGNFLWGTGVAFLPDAGTRIYFQLEPDGNNGLVACWKHVGPTGEVYAQRISGSGTLPWGNNGIIINLPTDTEAGLTGIGMAKDGEGNYVVSWKKDTITTAAPYGIIKAQKFNNDGILLTPAQGLPICNIDNNNAYDPSLIKSLDTSTFFAWYDSRGIYAALVNADGILKNIPVINASNIAGGNWDDPSIWAGGTIPSPGANVTITQNITVNTNIICNSITVQPPAVITINPGATVTVFNN